MKPHGTPNGKVATFTAPLDLPGDWRFRAACGDEPNKELWFPVGTSGPAMRQTAEAKTVCRRCPVITECLTWALETGQEGVWGGMSEEERRRIRKSNAKTRARMLAAAGVSL